MMHRVFQMKDRALTLAMTFLLVLSACLPAAASPRPRISRLDPKELVRSATPGDESSLPNSVTVNVIGSHFTRDSFAAWQGVRVPTIFKSRTRLIATIDLRTVPMREKSLHGAQSTTL